VIDHLSAVVGPVDLLINAAGVRAWSALLAPGALDSAETVLAVNLLAPLRLAVGLASAMWRSQPDQNLRANRNIVNLSSSAGLFVYPDAGQALYGSSKSALNQLTYHLASEFWDIGVRVNAVAPDSFPGRVATGRVLEAIVALDQSACTGKIVRILPGAGEDGGGVAHTGRGS
jgi:NAD(P)-dependent dehydrogenase (short-subunit alcohol dehydrogenase family)